MSAESINIHEIGAMMDRVSGLPLASKPLSGLLTGEVQTVRRGDGYDPDGLRTYEYGDDFRRINWAATARNTDGDYIVQQYFADQSPVAYVVSDVLGHRYRTNPGLRSERELGIGLGILTMSMAKSDGLPVGMVWSNGLQTRVQQPTHDRATLVGGFKRAVEMAEDVDAAFERSLARPTGRLSRLRRKTEAVEPLETFGLSTTLRRAGELAINESVVVIISDFRDVFDPEDRTDGWASPLERIARQNDVIAIELTNKWDRQLPDNEPFLRDPQTGELMPVTDALRNRYAQQEAERSEKIHSTLRRATARHITVDTEVEDWARHFSRQVERTVE